jgi:hypothetical protein
VHEARFGADDLGQVRQEGDDIMPGLTLDLVDARDIECGVQALGPDDSGRVARDDAELGHGVGRMRFDLEPDAIAGFGAPYLSHDFAGVTRDHRKSPQKARKVMMV